MAGFSTFVNLFPELSKMPCSTIVLFEGCISCNVLVEDPWVWANELSPEFLDLPRISRLAHCEINANSKREINIVLYSAIQFHSICWYTICRLDQFPVSTPQYSFYSDQVHVIKIRIRDRCNRA